MFTSPSEEEAPAQELRHFFLLRPGVIFLNHGSFGSCPLPVFNHYQEWQRELEQEPVEFLGRRFNDLMRGARAALAAYLNAPADDLVYVPNATTGVNILARSLALKPGDEILASDHEYGALDRAWQFVCQKNGAVYKRQPISLPVTTPEEFLERLWSGVTPRTRVVFLSHISSPTALIFPVKEVCRRAHAEGLVTIIDGAHAPGQIPVDLLELGADYYVGTCHKWMNSPKGAGFLYARPGMQSLLEPLVVSWGWQSETPGPSRFVDEQEWQGTRDIAAYLSVPAAIEFMREHNWPRVQRECHELARYACKEITLVTGQDPISPETGQWYAQMIALPLPHCRADDLKRRLYDEFHVEAPVITWNGCQFLRVSLQAYNNRDDVDTLVRGLQVLLPQVAAVD
jgi:isopenicillin-N epimerase